VEFVKVSTIPVSLSRHDAQLNLVNILAETSKRGTTFQRSKIVKKAAETRKKNNRDNRKNETWKSSESSETPPVVRG
jgi:F0F1-type ATP synthase epsilon subunit